MVNSLCVFFMLDASISLIESVKKNYRKLLKRCCLKPKRKSQTLTNVKLDEIFRATMKDYTITEFIISSNKQPNNIS